MNPNLIFSGPIGSGKTSISKLIATSLGYGWNSFGATVKRIAIERSISVERERLQSLGEQEISENPSEFCLRVLQEAPGFPHDPVIIDGLRHTRIRDLLQKLSSPRPLVCIYIHVDDVTRLSRTERRDNISPDRIRALDLHSTEIEVKSGIRDIANFVADNNGDQLTTCSTILHWMALKVPAENSAL